ncbi:MAG TPA: FAD-dependent oxidoreductase [Micromonosporaceae bacterium]|jgi:NADPH-dependent 2,4-dienoyl-CoA reductase/sulfur reductase-like enzyme
MDASATPATPDCDLLVVGGGPGAVGAIRGFRRHHGRGDVILASAEAILPYTRPMLSKDYLRGDAQDTELPVEAADFYGGVELRLGNDVVALEPDRSTAVLISGEEITFRSCVLVTGSDPAPLPVTGGDDGRVYLLRSLADARRLRGAAETASSAVVCGSGFIGCEAAVSLARRGLAVTMVSQERLPQFDRLGETAGERLASWLREEQVTLVMDAEIAEIRDGHTALLHGDRPAIEADLVLSGAGIAPRIDLARSAGLTVEDGRVQVDDRMRSTQPHIFAAGDIALAYNASAGRRIPVEHWGEALRMGEVAGATAAGGDKRWDAVPGFWTQIGDRTLKYAAWGDGFDEVRVIDNESDAFTIWYGRDGIIVGALTYNADPDYERASNLARAAAPMAAIDDLE